MDGKCSCQSAGQTVPSAIPTMHPFGRSGLHVVMTEAAQLVSALIALFAGAVLIRFHQT